MHFAFIVNPAAGNGYSLEIMQKLEESMKARGTEYSIYRTEKPGHGTELAAMLSDDSEISAVISVGGDGTAGEVAAGLTGTGKPMGIIPAGTGNDFIKSAGIPNDPYKALDLLLAGKAKETDTGTVNDCFFLNVCFLGLIKAIFHYKSIHLKITADSQAEEKQYLICSVANGRFIGGGIPICPKADIQDGKLDLVLIDSVPRWRIPFYLPGLMLSRDLSFKITRHRKVSEIIVEGSQLRVNIDGDIRSMDRAEFRINPGSLMMIR